MNLGATPEGQIRLVRELDRLSAIGINNLRIMGAFEGPDAAPWRAIPSSQPEPGEFSEEIMKGLDFLLKEMADRQMTAVICLGNFWHWSGGFAQYVSWVTGTPIPYPPPAERGNWLRFMRYSAQFFELRKAIELYQQSSERLLRRINTFTGKAYRDDPTIMAWQLANEPRGLTHRKAYLDWIRESALMFRSLAPHQMVSIGSEGKTPTRLAGTYFPVAHEIPEIDYLTCHIWPENWDWYDPQKPEATFSAAMKKARKYLDYHQRIARKIGKPLVLEEFGLARDLRHFMPLAPTSYRDQFFQQMISLTERSIEAGEPLTGLAYWAWGGDGRPGEAGGFWRLGDDFLGDPPHEPQGWYSIYESDRSTLELIAQVRLGKGNLE